MASDYPSIRKDNERRYGTDIGRIGPMLLAHRYDDRTHFIYELLQNAEDALAKRGRANRQRSVRFPSFGNVSCASAISESRSTRTMYVESAELQKAPRTRTSHRSDASASASSQSMPSPTSPRFTLERRISEFGTSSGRFPRRQSRGPLTRRSSSCRSGSHRTVRKYRLACSGLDPALFSFCVKSRESIGRWTADPRVSASDKPSHLTGRCGASPSSAKSRTSSQSSSRLGGCFPGRYTRQGTSWRAKSKSRSY